MSREAVLAAAHEVLEREGLEQVTMRRLAAELGVAPNALYSYFPNKTALLDSLLDVVLADVPVPEPDECSWEEGLATLMRASRRALLAHPRLVPLFIARPGGANAIRLGEAMLVLLARGGVHGRTAVDALRTLLVYTLGFAAFEVPRVSDPAGQGRLDEAAERIRALPAEAYPLTRELGEHLATHPSHREFDIGLGWLLDGIARDADAHRWRGKR